MAAHKGPASSRPRCTQSGSSVAATPNYHLQQVTEGKMKGLIEVTGRRGRRRRKLLDDLKERRGYSHLKEKALDRTMWRARFGKVFETDY
jgi:hypothetical protein